MRRQKSLRTVKGAIGIAGAGLGGVVEGFLAQETGGEATGNVVVVNERDRIPQEFSLAKSSCTLPGFEIVRVLRGRWFQDKGSWFCFQVCISGTKRRKSCFMHHSKLALGYS